MYKDILVLYKTIQPCEPIVIPSQGLGRGEWALKVHLYQFHSRFACGSIRIEVSLAPLP